MTSTETEIRVAGRSWADALDARRAGDVDGFTGQDQPIDGPAATLVVDELEVGEPSARDEVIDEIVERVTGRILAALQGTTPATEAPERRGWLGR